MTFDEFIQSLSSDTPPAGLSVLLLSLWYDKKSDWEKSHDIISEIESREAAHIHAYLHRKKGDMWNADYWYRRAQQLRPTYSLEEEWNQLTEKFLS